MPFLRWFFDEVIPNVIANLLADVFSPASMTGWLFALGTIVWVAVNWNRRQRAANKPGYGIVALHCGVLHHCDPRRGWRGIRFGLALRRQHNDIDSSTKW